MSTKDPIFVLCDRVRETAFALHKYHRHGHAKKVHENGLAQLLGYLRSAQREHGLLINFGTPILQIKKYALSDPIPLL